MKKHFTLFFIYAAIIIAGLSLFLIFHNKTKEKPSNNNSQQAESNTNSNGGGTNNGNTDNTIYATKLTLNCARTLDIKTNSSVELIGNYLTIEPANATITITITADKGNNSDLTFANNKITTTTEGKYRIRFSSLKNSTTELADTLIVNVKENVANLISQKTFQTIIGSELNLCDVFEIDSSITNTTIQTDNKINFNNNLLVASAIGESVITILYDVGYFRLTFVATLLVKEQPLYVLSIVDVRTGTGEVITVVNNTINYECNIGDNFSIQYNIKNRNEEYVNQAIEIELTDENIASYKITNPLIKVVCLNKGSIDLTIICKNDTESRTTITINFV